MIRRPLVGLAVMGAMLMATACNHSHHSSHTHTTVVHHTVHHTVVHHHVVHHH